MMRVTLQELCLGFGGLALLAGCSGSAVTDGPGGSAGGAGNAGTAGAVSAAGMGGKVGSGGSGQSAGTGGASPSAGSSGAGAPPVGDCTDGATMPAGCNTCTCGGGVWHCTALECNTSCGGIRGSACTDQEYCAYSVGQLCGEADASSTCKLRPTACDEIYAPVCGCDMKTYSSECDAASHGQGVLMSGACGANTAE